MTGIYADNIRRCTQEAHNSAYAGLSLMQTTFIADPFYERVKDKDGGVLKRYLEYTAPKSFMDRISLAFDEKRYSRRAAVKRVLLERELKE